MTTRSEGITNPQGFSWSGYYDAVTGEPPSATLMAALQGFATAPAIKRPRVAVDLGCGIGNDTVELLARGWRVLAIDAEPESIARLRSRTDLPNQTRLETRVALFQDGDWGRADLINARLSLPFARQSFPQVWESIIDSLYRGGRFAGQLFGDRDGWAAGTRTLHHTRHEVEALLQPFTVELLREEEEPDGRTAQGQPKHWHVFHIVARKR